LNSDREKITVHELTLYLKYKNALIKATELKIKGKDRKLFTVDGNILKKDRNRTVLEKFTLDHGKLTSRSEEHTSELQSRFDLVCSLMFVKNNIKLNSYSTNIE